jgi:hypothetical protein
MFMHKSRKFGLIAGSTAAVVAALTGSGRAAISFTIAPAVTPADSYFDYGTAQTYNGFSAYVITVTPDAGDTLDGVQAGGGTNDPTFGFFGPLVQDWETVQSRGNPTSTFTPTPQLATLNNTGTAGPALDSHLVVTPGIVVDPLVEDNNTVNPGLTTAQISNNGGYDELGTGTHLQGDFSVTPSTGFTLAYIVLKNGTSATYNVSVSEGPTGSAANVVSTFTGTIGAVVPTTHNIISLTAGNNTAGTNYGSADGTIAVGGPGHSSYLVTPATGFTAGATGSTNVSGFNPTTDTEIYGLKLLVGGIAPTQTQLSQIVTDINSGTGDNVTAGLIGSLPAVFTSVFTTATSGYNLFLTSTNGFTATGGSDLGFDFSQETNVAGVTVAGIAAVPEPATAAGIVLGAAGLLLGRRRNRAVVA